MAWLHPFIALSLCSGAVVAVLPQGSLKKTASLVIGLLLMLCWLDCASDLLDWPGWVLPSGSALTETGYSYQQALEALAGAPGGE